MRGIPSIDRLLQRPSIDRLRSRFGRPAVVDALRAGAAHVRASPAAESASENEEEAAARIESFAEAALVRAFAPSLEPVINATGVVIHTNLGRAPLGESAVMRVATVARGYSTLEYDTVRGARGRRDSHAAPLLRRLTGAEAAVIVNNNAAATLLVLAALGAGREVIVSRGELVEIGGGFRIPDVMRQSGATLREVGTTNRTRTADYAAAIGERTAAILRVHPSNFRIEGFVERPSLEDLVALGSRFGIPVVEDLGSGFFADGAAARHPLAEAEPPVAASIAAGVDVCCFSGDKLLGGPQCGIIAGRAPLVERIGRHPLMRALRADKMTYAALEATLAEYAAGRAPTSVPVVRMIRMSAEDIRVRADALAAAVAKQPGWRATMVAGTSAVGGGSAPGITLPTWLVAIERDGLTAAALEERLRSLTPPVVARIEDDRVVLDLRTVFPDQDRPLAASIISL